MLYTQLTTTITPTHPLSLLQEVMWHQLLDIDKLIGSEYDHVAAGREDGEKQGEVS